MKYIMAIDQGTTGSRAVIYDKNGKKIKSAYQEFKQYFPKPGWVEHNPLEIWQSVNSSIQKVLKEVPVSSIIAIGITNQRETTVVWDRKTGAPVYNAIVWQCRRTASRCAELKNTQPSPEYLSKKTGLPIDAYFSATKLEWILNHVKNLRKRARDGEILFGTTDTWILWKLTGGKVHATDYTNASRTMLFNIESLTWDKDILDLLAIPDKVLPQVQPSASIFGHTVKVGRLTAGIPISGIAGDQQAALFGQTCFEPGTAKNTYGTGAFLLLNTGKKRIFSKYGLITTIGCDEFGKPAYVLEGSIFIAGAAIQWLRDQLQIIQSAVETEKAALALGDNEGVYFVPALVGLGAPYWDPHARGNISGITRGTTKGHIIRAALEAMCYQTKDVLDAMEKDSALKIRELKIDGGAVVNNFLCQFQSDILQIPVIRPRIIETTSLGAAFLAGLHEGYWKNASQLKNCWEKERDFKPRMKKARAGAFYQDWRRAVARSR
jgi:glycerol kinase